MAELNWGAVLVVEGGETEPVVVITCAVNRKPRRS